MATLRTDHEYKRPPYKDRDALLSFLLDEDAINQRMADVLELFATHLRSRAKRIGQLTEPALDPAAAPPRTERTRREDYPFDRRRSPLRPLPGEDNEKSGPGAINTEAA